MFTLIDPNNGLEVVRQDASLTWVKRVVGEPGSGSPIRLPRQPGTAAFSPDTAHEEMDRNVVGSLVLVSLGASAYPYVGPLVIVGWDDHHQPPEVVNLRMVQLHHIEETYRHCVEVLAGFGQWPDDAGLYDYGRWVRESPWPALRVEWEFR